ncbi:hypothetical protein QE364_002068 [Nocardioides zeae]|uniref:Uncharacterized protein n=2 Tax=Nocardioides zeae TaxID=1457234 RepID=A0ACC6IIB8_9ACTN|nr:hypothetical protein [Nocardioides zeae]MDQ1104098.1 hypothetical protein [Nocardioides zeae]MDR6176211.1 hypothetical protein [Nocardioides zeae]MDR6210357.1 hypothetical protein [Nocardioides zeae]
MTHDPDQHAFVADLASLMKRWGLPPVTGQLYAYLLLQEDPVDLDTMVLDLGASKSGLSVAARQLESWFLVRRISQPGSRRILYEVDGDIERLLKVNGVQLKRFSSTLRDGARVAQGSTQRRLTDIADLFDVYVDVSNDVLEQRRAERTGPPDPGQVAALRDTSA